MDGNTQEIEQEAIHKRHTREREVDVQTDEQTNTCTQKVSNVVKERSIY